MYRTLTAIQMPLEWIFKPIRGCGLGIRNQPAELTEMSEWITGFHASWVKEISVIFFSSSHTVRKMSWKNRLINCQSFM
jgi:hypothetical protein